MADKKSDDIINIKEKLKNSIIKIAMLIITALASIIVQDMMNRIQKLEYKIEEVIQNSEK